MHTERELSRDYLSSAIRWLYSPSYYLHWLCRKAVFTVQYSTLTSGPDIIIQPHPSQLRKLDLFARQVQRKASLFYDRLPLSITIKTQVTFFMPGRKSLRAVRLRCLSSAAMTEHGPSFTGAALYNIAGSLTWECTLWTWRRSRSRSSIMRMRKLSEPHLLPMSVCRRRGWFINKSLPFGAQCMQYEKRRSSVMEQEVEQLKTLVGDLFAKIEVKQTLFDIRNCVGWY